jgi:hypothetical protein
MDLASDVEAPVDGSDEEEEEVGVPDDQNPLKCDDLCWIHEPDGVSECTRAIKGAREFEASIRWPTHMQLRGIKDRTKLDYFLVFFPDLLSKICILSTPHLQNGAKHPLTVHELVKFFGIMLGMCLCPRTRRDQYWAVLDSDLFPALNFGRRFGMSRDRWADIMSALTTYPPDVDENDPWYKIRTFLNAFNDRQVETFSP